MSSDEKPPFLVQFDNSGFGAGKHKIRITVNVSDAEVEVEKDQLALTLQSGLCLGTQAQPINKVALDGIRALSEATQAIERAQYTHRIRRHGTVRQAHDREHQLQQFCPSAK